jgi:hypothetical protein
MAINPFADLFPDELNLMTGGNIEQDSNLP